MDHLRDIAPAHEHAKCPNRCADQRKEKASMI
jgi:hypothetical protein